MKKEDPKDCEMVLTRLGRDSYVAQFMSNSILIVATLSHALVGMEMGLYLSIVCHFPSRSCRCGTVVVGDSGFVAK